MSWFCITMTIMRAKSCNDLNVSYLYEVDSFVRCKDSLHFCKRAKERCPQFSLQASFSMIYLKCSIGCMRQVRSGGSLRIRRLIGRSRVPERAFLRQGRGARS